MEMKGSVLIPASRTLVWEALNDPDVLRHCIPGCEALEIVSPTLLKARVVLKVGPIKARFSGEVTLNDLDPPKGYVLSGEGEGGLAGMAKGTAHIRLETTSDEQTVLEYDANVDVRGKIAQLGARLLESTATRLVKQFFDKFSCILASDASSLHESQNG